MSSDAPADITQAEWDKHRGQVLRTSAQVDSLFVEFRKTNQNLELTRIEMKSLRAAINEFKRGVAERLDKHSDWRETTDQRDRAELEQQLTQYKGRDERRIALWVKIVFGVLAGLVEAGIVHWMHLK